MKNNVPPVKQGNVAIGQSKMPKVVDSPVVGADDIKRALRDTDVSVANMHAQEYKGTKTDGIKIRGTGAATKGVMARGPMC